MPLDQERPSRWTKHAAEEWVCIAVVPYAFTRESLSHICALPAHAHICVSTSATHLWLAPPHHCSCLGMGRQLRQTHRAPSGYTLICTMTKRTNRVRELTQYRVSWGTSQTAHMLSVDYQNYQIWTIMINELHGRTFSQTVWLVGLWIALASHKAQRKKVRWPGCVLVILYDSVFFIKEQYSFPSQRTRPLSLLVCCFLFHKDGSNQYSIWAAGGKTYFCLRSGVESHFGIILVSAVLGIWRFCLASR